MISVYVNYRKPRFTIHADPACQLLQMLRTEGQRRYEVTSANLRGFLAELVGTKPLLASESGLSDLWIDIRLDTPEQEQGLVYVVQALLCQRYKPLATAPVHTHCP